MTLTSALRAACAFGFAALLMSSRPVSAQTLFSAGLYKTPETISPVPAGFGGLGGNYLIPDFNRGTVSGPIWLLSQNGGPPSVFATASSDRIYLGGLFLPGSGWGSNSGSFLAVGENNSALSPQTGEMDVFSPNGQVSPLTSVAGADFGPPLLASGTFGAYSGDVITANQFNHQVFALAPNGTTTVIANNLPIQPFGTAFAPSGFGALGGGLLASDIGSSQIDLIGANGSVSPFATVPLKAGQTGLRQMAFSPPGFLPGYGSLLFVSVSGSTQGGGTAGDVLALNSAGQTLYSLRLQQGLTKFDPRGLYFTSDGHLLISDASDPIDIVRPQDFQPAGALVPESSGLVNMLGALLAVGVGSLFLRVRKVHLSRPR